MTFNGMISVDCLALNIAGMEFSIDKRDSHIELAVPFMYEKFMAGQRQHDCFPLKKERISLTVKNEGPSSKKDWGKSICRTVSWELWQNERGDYIFLTPRHSPQKRVVINAAFTSGEVIGDFSELGGKKFYPLYGIDIRILVNWLAQFGDMILHASGIAYQHRGYCFIGKSGAGKSTLAEELKKNQQVLVLGEDQVILRYAQGQFWVCGTPWHERESMCSPACLPLRKIFFLDREGLPGIQDYPAINALTTVLQTAFIPYYLHQKIDLIMGRLTQLSEVVPFFKLNYQLGASILEQISE